MRRGGMKCGAGRVGLGAGRSGRGGMGVQPRAGRVRRCGAPSRRIANANAVPACPSRQRLEMLNSIHE